MSTFDDHANFAWSLVTVPPVPAASGLSLTVADASLFPTAPFNAIVWPAGECAFASNAEIIRVTVFVGNVFTILRAQEGTTARAIQVGDQIGNAVTVKVIDDLQNAITSLESDAVIIDPASSLRNVIEPTGDFIPLTLRGIVGQTQDLQHWTNDALVPLALVTAGGELVIGQVAPNGALLQTFSAYTEPADLFAAHYLETEFTETTDDELTWYGTYLFNTLDGGDAGTQSQSLNTMTGLYVENKIDTRNADPLAYTLYSGDAITGLAWTPPGQTGYAGSLAGVNGRAFHNGDGEAFCAGVAGFAVMKGSPDVRAYGDLSIMQGVIGSVENTSDAEVPYATAIYASFPYLNAMAGSRVTNLQGVRIDNQGDSKVKNSIGLWIKAQSGSTVSIYSILSEGGNSELRAGAATQVPLTLKAFAAQSDNLLNLRNSANVLLTAFSETGVLEFGTTGDTNLYRSAADVLKTDDSFLVGATLEQDGTLLGLLGAAPVVQQAASSITALWTALKNYGLLTGSSTAPSVIVSGDSAGGVLSGTYPNPGFAVDMATQAELDAVAAADLARNRPNLIYQDMILS